MENVRVGRRWATNAKEGRKPLQIQLLLAVVISVGFSNWNQQLNRGECDLQFLRMGMRNEYWNENLHYPVKGRNPSNKEEV